jgi:hypothetical protein
VRIIDEAICIAGECERQEVERRIIDFDHMTFDVRATRQSRCGGMILFFEFFHGYWVQSSATE